MSRPDCLGERFTAAGSDKACYAAAYEILLAPRRAQVRRLLEIGIGTLQPGAHSTMAGYAPGHYRPGASLRVWRDYFPNAEVIGIDVQPDTQLAEPRIRTLLCDSTDAAAMAEVRRTALAGEHCDVIIDDGSHRSEDQLATLANCFPLLAPGGLYFIEDIGEGRALFEDYRLVAPLVGGAAYFEISDHDPGDGHRWKMLVIQAPRQTAPDDGAAASA